MLLIIFIKLTLYFGKLESMSLSRSYVEDRSQQDSYSQEQITSIDWQIQIRNKPQKFKPGKKCLQDNLVYASSLPAWFCTEKVVKDQKYFGKYGTITTIYFAENSLSNRKVAQSKQAQAYISYKDKRDAALAIAALNQMRLWRRTLRGTYGTTRLCENYVKGNVCKKKNCYFLHDETNVIKIQEPFRTDYDKQKLIAYEMINKNLCYFLQKIEIAKHEKEQNLASKKQESFLSIKQVIDILMCKNIITKYTYTIALQAQLSTKKKMSESVKKIEYVRYKTKSSLEGTQAKSSQPKTSIANSGQVSKEVTQQQQKKQSLQPVILPIVQMKMKSSRLKSEFLMDRITESIDSINESILKKVCKPKQFQDEKKNWQSLIVLGNLYDKDEEWEQQLLETEQSESGSCEKQNQSIQEFKNQLTKHENLTPFISQKDSSPNELCNILLDKIRSQILKPRMVKASKLQFTMPISYSQKVKQFQKVTNILKSKLIC